MKNTRPMHRYAPALLSALACVAAPAVSLGSDTYNPASHLLTIPQLQYGLVTYYDMVVTPGPSPTIEGGTPLVTFDSYGPVLPSYTNELHAASVTVGATTFTNVLDTITSMTSVGSVSGADWYDGTYLYIPSARVGNAFVKYGIITVAGIDTLAQGFPTGTSDTYNGANNQLTIPAVQVGSKAYTNVTVTVGSVVGVNGTGNPNGVGPKSSTCYNPAIYTPGTTSDLTYGDPVDGPLYEAVAVVQSAASFGGVDNAIAIQTTTTTSQGSSVATIHYDVSQAPLIAELGVSTTTSSQVFSPGIPFGGAVTYGQALQGSGTYSYTGGSNPYTTDYVFLGYETLTVGAGTFVNACKWSLSENIGTGETTVTTWSSHKGVLLKVGTTELLSGTLNNGPVGP